jgi:ABC-2 family transporter protein
MSFLPIVDRELRVAARRKSTYYARGGAALLGIVIGGFYMLLFTITGPSSTGLGNYMFMIVSWYGLLTTLLAGVFLSSDSLSEERREGTLGLLFLTDLKGHDVVVGKFVAVSLNAFYGLLAVFPVLAICQLTGGVGLAEFWRTCLALLNFLFFSVTAGMLVSSFCQSAARAMAGTLASLFIWLLVAGVAAAVGLDAVARFSPFQAFRLASDAQYFRLAREYWESLAISFLTGCFFLAWSGWRLRKFIDTGKTTGAWPRIFARNVLSSTAPRRRKLLDINPVLWLLDDSRVLRWVVWLLTLMAVVFLVWLLTTSPMAMVIMNPTLWIFYFLLKISFAIQSCRFFAEARRTGALELLCCTPLTMRAVIAGQWMLLRRAFLWPVIFLLSAHLAALLLSMSKNQGPMSTPGLGGILFFYMYFKVIPNTVADFFAIGWFGMWLALSLQRPNLAAGLTILCVLILPMIAFCVPALAIDAIFIVVGSTKLSEDFRLRQAQWAIRKPAIS